MNKEVVVLLHGIWMPGAEMWLMQRRLANDHGFDARTYAYPSVRPSLDENAEMLQRYLRGLDADALHLVGHSLGGVLALRALAQAPDLPPGRVVCLGSPLCGSRAAESLARFGWGRAMAGNTLGQGVIESPASDWAEPVTSSREVGVIAGTVAAGMGRILTKFDEDNDGTVAVSETRLPGIRDHLCLPVNHTAMVASKEVVARTAAFLARGSFATTADS